MATPETHSWPAWPRVVFVLAVLGGTGWIAARFLWPALGLVEVVAIPPVQPAPAAIPTSVPAPSGTSVSPRVEQAAAGGPAPNPGREAVPRSVPVAVSTSAPVTAPPVAAVDAGDGPRFDIVRVGPQGTAVIAGRAAPGSEVVVRDGATEVGRGRADRQGSFVIIPAAPLVAGARELTLSSRTAGGAEVKGDGSVLLDVPRATTSAPAAPAMAVLVPTAATPRVLQDAPARVVGPAVTVDTVDYDDSGAIRFTGGAVTGDTLRLYIDNAAAGDARADAGGRWTVTPAGTVTAGVHTVRVDHLGADGRVLARVELPFQRVAVQSAEVAGGRVVVQPGQSLWRLARLAYGRGVQYRVIYLANKEQIRDPRLIYPGQTFSVPTP